jgi:glycine/D-amino acid oxidase-like deaminating enzyme
MYDMIVVGKGMMGSAAARYLSAAGARVALIGQDEPADYATHDGVFGSHYDEGRITHRLSKDPTWARLTVRAIEQYAAIERQSGIRFHTPCGGLAVARDFDALPYMRHREQIATMFDVAYTAYPEAIAIQRAHPMLVFPSGFRGVFEHAPAGYINPRALVRAQIKIAADQGATVVSDVVVKVDTGPDGVTVRTRSGQEFAGGQVLLACGAFANSYELLPGPLALRIKTETIILAEVDEHEAERLGAMPTVGYDIESPELVGIYLVPPIRFPDGKFYLKMGCDTASDQTLADLPAMQAWMRHGKSDTHKPAMTEALQSIIPGLRLESVRAGRCLVTYTPHGKPYVDQVAERVFVATGGNGSSAKCSDTLGWLAANLALGQPWEEFERAAFRVVFAEYADEYD